MTIFVLTNTVHDMTPKKHTTKTASKARQCDVVIIHNYRGHGECVVVLKKKGYVYYKSCYGHVCRVRGEENVTVIGESCDRLEQELKDAEAWVKRDAYVPYGDN